MKGYNDLKRKLKKTWYMPVKVIPVDYYIDFFHWHIPYFRCIKNNVKEIKAVVECYRD